MLQRVEVVKVFALSRVYYVASILPTNKTMVNKIEKDNWTVFVDMDKSREGSEGFYSGDQEQFGKGGSGFALYWFEEQGSNGEPVDV